MKYIKYKYIERDHTHDTRKNITIRIFVYIHNIYIHYVDRCPQNIIFLNFNQKHAFTTKKKNLNTHTHTHTLLWTQRFSLSDTHTHTLVKIIFIILIIIINMFKMFSFKFLNIVIIFTFIICRT